MSERSPFEAIRAIDYTVIFVRDMEAMRRFYEGVLRFRFVRELSPDWIEYQVGGNTLALARPRRVASDPPTPKGSASLQLAFRVPPPDVDRCAEELVRHGVSCSRRPPTTVSGTAPFSSAIRTGTCWRCTRKSKGPRIAAPRGSVPCHC